MDFFKRFGLFFIATLCVIFLISPADVMPGMAIDDILYLVGAVASIGKVKELKKADY